MTTPIIGGGSFLGTELIRQARAAGHSTAATYHSARPNGTSKTLSGDADELVAARDSKPQQTPLVFARDEIAAMLGGAKNGSFDHLA